MIPEGKSEMWEKTVRKENSKFIDTNFKTHQLKIDNAIYLMKLEQRHNKQVWITGI